MTYPNGSSYEGEWEYDHYEGRGTFIDTNGVKTVAMYTGGKKYRTIR